MAIPIWHSYDRPETHAIVSRIIRERSRNASDVREVALAGLDLSRARRILSLGCGFGFLAETLAARVAPQAEFTGIDACGSNAEPYLRRVAAGGGRGRFLAAEIKEHLEFPARSFDLVVCSYALYFFPAILPDVARVLAPRGTFVVITHSERSFAGLLRASGLAAGDSPLTELVRRWSSENAPARLAALFAKVERRDYPNELRFGRQHLADLLTYVRFKMPLLIPGASVEEGVPAAVRDALERWLAQHGEIVVEKDDACYQCRGPRVPLAGSPTPRPGATARPPS